MVTIAGTGTGGYNGDNIIPTLAQLNFPRGIAVGVSGIIYIAEQNNNRIRMVNETAGKIITIAGNGNRGYSGDNGPAISCQLSTPGGVAVDTSGDIYIVDTGNNRVRLVTISTGIITSLAGNGNSGYSGDNGPALSAQLRLPYGITVDLSKNIYIVDTYNQRIRLVTRSTGIITTIAGNGNAAYRGDNSPALSASLYFPLYVAISVSGDVYIADTYNHAIRMITKRTSIITTIAGNGLQGYSGDNGSALSSRLAYPNGIVLDVSENIFITDSTNNKVRMIIKSTGIITTIASINYPTGIAFDRLRNNVVVSDSADNIVIRVSVLNRPTEQPTSQPTSQPTGMTFTFILFTILWICLFVRKITLKVSK